MRPKPIFVELIASAGLEDDLAAVEVERDEYGATVAFIALSERGKQLIEQLRAERHATAN